jgi:hypothetical protein
MSEYFVCKACEENFNEGGDVIYAFLTVSRAAEHEIDSHSPDAEVIYVIKEVN